MCVVLEHGSTNHRKMALNHIASGLLEYATNEQGAKSVTKALKEGGKETLDRIISRMCEPAKGYVLSIPCLRALLMFFQWTAGNDRRPRSVGHRESTNRERPTQRAYTELWFNVTR